MFAMFGATIVVPAVTGLDPAVALFAAGGGTLLFHFITKRKVPVFLGSSFAFMSALAFIVSTEGKEYATGAIMVAGACYLLFALLAKLIGPDRIKKLFPAIVTGPVIIVIGLTLAPSVIFNDISADFVGGMLWMKWVVAASVVLTVVIVSIFIKGFFKLLPILCGLVVGYGVALILHFTVALPEGAATLMNFAPFDGVAIIQLPKFHLPAFSASSILIIAPISIATFMEHLGDITTNGAVVGKNFFEDPGLHRTLIGRWCCNNVCRFYRRTCEYDLRRKTRVFWRSQRITIRRLSGSAACLCDGSVDDRVLRCIFADHSGACYRRYEHRALRYDFCHRVSEQMAEAKVDFTKSRIC